MENNSKSELQIKCEQFCRPRPDRYSAGFVIGPRKGLTVNPGIGFLGELKDAVGKIHTCGGNGDRNLANWAQKSISDLLIHGKMAVEFIWKETAGGRMDFVGFAHVPVLSVCNSEQPGFSYYQIVDNRPVQGFTKDELIVWDKTPFCPDSSDRCFTILESFINDEILKRTGPLGYLFEFSFKTEEAEESVEAREEKRETLIGVLREQLLHERTVAAVKTDKAEQLKKKVEELETLVTTNIKERDILATEKAELHQKLADSEETCKELRGNLAGENGATNMWRAEAYAERSTSNRLRDGVKILQDRIKMLEIAVGPTVVLPKDPMVVDVVSARIHDKLKEENTSLKLENQKLKGLIEEARKYVATANLMLA